MTIKRSLHGASPIVKRFSAENFSKYRQKRTQNGGFFSGLKVKLFNRERHILAETASFDYFV